MARFIRDRLDHGGHRRQLVISSALMAIVLAGTGSAALAASGSGKSAANGPLGAVTDTYSTADLGTLAVNAGRGVLANDSGAPLQIVGHTDPAHGSLTLQPDGSFEYVPQAGFTGQDTFTYTITDAVQLYSTQGAGATSNMKSFRASKMARTRRLNRDLHVPQ